MTKNGRDWPCPGKDEGKNTIFIGERCLFSCVSSLMAAFIIAGFWSRALYDERALDLFETDIVTPDGQPVRNKHTQKKLEMTLGTITDISFQVGCRVTAARFVGCSKIAPACHREYRVKDSCSSRRPVGIRF
jgi:hypothetical protein